ncbi:MAG: CCA tRNA nucleotidyltransferase [Candidatus Sericytochromatia bacterium]|nr:CCA tRNA nucleotidyltransferase [Candidatus Sericytochromatia bacterium]
MLSAAELSLALSTYLPEPVLLRLQEAGALAAERGLSLYLIGGSVRDMLLPERSFDWDIDLVSEQTGIVALAETLAQRWAGELHPYPQYGTATLRLKPLELDFATARTEHYTHPGANPEVSFSTLHADLVRRDFSINALALNLHPERWCELTDPFDGVKHLQQRVLQTWREDKFSEDPVRGWRAARLSVSLNFAIAAETAVWLKQTMASGCFDGFLNRRICSELWKCLEKPLPDVYLTRLDALGVLRCLSPSLHWTAELAGCFERLRRLQVQFDEVSIADAYLLVLLAHLTEPWNSSLLKALHLPRALQNSWFALARQLGYTEPPASASEAFQRFSGVSATTLWVLWALQTDTEAPLAAAISHYWQQTRFIQPPLSGKMLLELVPRGPWLRDLLWQVHAARIDGQIETHHQAQILAHQLAKQWLLANGCVPQGEDN